MAGLRLILIPRYGVDESADWYGWLRTQLNAKKKEINLDELVFVKPEPSLHAPEIGPSVAALRKVLGAGDAANTGIIGHSLGAQIALRMLAEKQGGPIKALLCVGGWLKLDQKAKMLKTFLEQPFDEAAAKTHAGRIVNLFSKSDPNQMMWEDVRKEWEKRLGAEMRFVPTPGHFSEKEEPDVLQAVLDVFGK